jgi:hypothetical protein
MSNAELTASWEKVQRKTFVRVLSLIVFTDLLPLLGVVSTQRHTLASFAVAPVFRYQFGRYHAFLLVALAATRNAARCVM